VEISTRTVIMAGHRFHFERRGGTFPWAETNTIAAVRPRISRDRADWQLFGSVFSKLTDKFSTGDPKKQWWELFRKAGNEVCSARFDVTNSAFDHTWTGRDFYGNPPFEGQFIYRMQDKALADFSSEPQNTRFLFILPYWPQSNWYGFVKHFKVLETFPKDTMMFSASATGVLNTSSLKPAGDEGGPGRFLIEGTPWPVIAVYLDATTSTTVDDSVKLHLRLGHPGERATEHIAAKYEHGLQTNAAKQTCKHCHVCKLAKATRVPAYPSTSTYDMYSTFALVFSDIHGPLSPTSYSGQRFMIHFTCTSRYTFVYFMETRDQAADRLAQFSTSVSQLGHTVAAIVLRTDGDSVYTSGDLAGICESQGIKQEISAPYVHTNAAVAERLWRTVLDITRALLSTSGLSHDIGPLRPDMRRTCMYGARMVRWR